MTIWRRKKSLPLGNNANNAFAATLSCHCDFGFSSSGLAPELLPKKESLFGNHGEKGSCGKQEESS